MRRALVAVASAGPWLREAAALTRYAHVPLAGLGRDALMSIADVLMARRLREAGHVLWTVDPALPDLGERISHQPIGHGSHIMTPLHCPPRCRRYTPSSQLALLIQTYMPDISCHQMLLLFRDVSGMFSRYRSTA